MVETRRPRAPHEGWAEFPVSTPCDEFSRHVTIAIDSFSGLVARDKIGPLRIID